MKTLPVILRDDEVRDIRDGRKTQLRRLIKRAVDRAGESACAIHPASESGWILWFGLPLNSEKMAEFTRKRYKHGVPCPFGKPCDRLWVKEAWGDRADYATIGKLRSDRFYYRVGDTRSGWKYRNSANMPRIASRMTLEVVSVRPERLQSITEADAIAEGFSASTECVGDACSATLTTARVAFLDAWRDRHGSDSIDANHWVWVCDFKWLEGVKGASA